MTDAAKPELELFRQSGSDCIWHVHRNGQYVGNFVLKTIELTPEIDRVERKDFLGDTEYILPYNPRLEISLHGTLYPEIPENEIRQAFAPGAQAIKNGEPPRLKG